MKRRVDYYGKIVGKCHYSIDRLEQTVGRVFLEGASLTTFRLGQSLKVVNSQRGTFQEDSSLKLRFIVEILLLNYELNLAIKLWIKFCHLIFN